MIFYLFTFGMLISLSITIPPLQHDDLKCDRLVLLIYLNVLSIINVPKPINNAMVAGSIYNNKI